MGSALSPASCHPFGGRYSSTTLNFGLKAPKAAFYADSNDQNAELDSSVAIEIIVFD